MEKDDDRKQDILAGAFSVLMKNGLPRLSYDLIAKEAGVSRQLIRYYFSEPDELMVALCDYLASSYREALIKGVLETQTENRLKFFFDFYFDLVNGFPKPRDDQVYDAVLSLAAGNNAIRSNLRAQYTLIGQVVSHEIHLAHPEIGREFADELSYLFVCLMYGHWKMVASLGLSEDHKYITRQAMDRLIHSYTGKKFDLAATAKIWSASEDG